MVVSSIQNRLPDVVPDTQLVDILIVDDVPDNIRFLSVFLLQQGYTVRKAINGQMALMAVEKLAPDLILLDVNLPDMSGHAVCRSLKKSPATAAIPVIFLSAGSQAIDKVEGFQAGAADYITKPFDLEEVLIRIQTQLTIQKLQKESKLQNEQLKRALEELKLAQANLVQQEKMATLRKVVAGVAHEINNPLSFIAGNIKPTQEYITQLLTLISVYRQKHFDPDIETLTSEMELEFIAEDLLNILESMKNGVDRICAVVLALRIFTRLDESGIKQINFRESIDSVFALLQHRLNDRSDGFIIQVDQQYEETPIVACYADQMNQVIFNLLCNAIDSIEEKIKKNGYQTLTPQISIQMQRLDQKTILIRIQDNGMGISEANALRLFEPFFTTKPAGQGVGLGLATSRRIVEEVHGGKLTYQPLVGGGSEFIIQVPS